MVPVSSSSGCIVIVLYYSTALHKPAEEVVWVCVCVDVPQGLCASDKGGVLGGLSQLCLV